MSQKKKTKQTAKRLSDIIGTEEPFLLDESGYAYFDTDVSLVGSYFRRGRHPSIGPTRGEMSHATLKTNQYVERYHQRVSAIIENQKRNPNIEVLKFLWSRLKGGISLNPILENPEDTFNGENALAYSCRFVHYPEIDSFNGSRQCIIGDRHPLTSKKLLPHEIRPIEVLIAIAVGYWRECDSRRGGVIRKKHDKLFEEEIERQGGRDQLSSQEFSVIYDFFLVDPIEREIRELMKEVVFELAQPADYVRFQDLLLSCGDPSKLEINSDVSDRKLKRSLSPIILSKFVKFARNWEPYNAVMPSLDTKLVIDFDALFGVEGFNDVTLIEKDRRSAHAKFN